MIVAFRSAKGADEDARCESRQLNAQLAKRSLGNLLVLSGGDAANADGTDDFALDDNRQAALHWDDSFDGQERLLSAGNGIFQRLRGPLEQGGRSRFALRD